MRAVILAVIAMFIAAFLFTYYVDPPAVRPQKPCFAFKYGDVVRLRGDPDPLGIVDNGGSNSGCNYSYVWFFARSRDGEPWRAYPTDLLEIVK